MARSKSWGSGWYPHTSIAAGTVGIFPISAVTGQGPDVVIERLIGKITIKGAYLLGAVLAVQAGVIVMNNTTVLSGVAFLPYTTHSGLEWLWTDTMFAHLPVNGVMNEHEMTVESSARRKMESSSEIVCAYVYNWSAVAIDVGLGVRYLKSE